MKIVMNHIVITISVKICRNGIELYHRSALLHSTRNLLIVHLMHSIQNTHDRHTHTHTLHCVCCFCEKQLCFSALCDFFSRMVNILLPAHSRHRAALSEAGLAGTADELDNNQELEHLVLRERGVAWADQEADETCSKEDGSEERLPPADKSTAAATSCELAPILTFSHLLYHQSSPCSESSPPPTVI